MYPRWASKQGDQKVWIQFSRWQYENGMNTGKPISQYTYNYISFGSPYNPTWTPPVWKEVPKSFALYGSLDCPFETGVEQGPLNPSANWTKLLEKADTGFTGVTPNGGGGKYGGDVKCWEIHGPYRGKIVGD